MALDVREKNREDHLEAVDGEPPAHWEAGVARAGTGRGVQGGDSSGIVAPPDPLRAYSAYACRARSGCSINRIA